MSQTETSSSIHGHEVLHLVEQHPGLSLKDLKSLAEVTFGIGAQYHTCHSEGMNLEDLLDFLCSRRKIEEKEGQLFLVRQNICSDGENHSHVHH